MPLDPQVRTLLESAAAAGTPTIDTLTPQEARQASRALNIVPLERREPIYRVEDATLPGPGGPIGIRIYRTSDASDPCLIYYHGGGWVRGDLDTYDHVCRALANRTPCTVLSVDYRLAPEHPFPAAVQDALAAYRAVSERAVDLGVDPNAIAVGGDSAGANLATVICALARDAGEPLPSCQILIYPVTDCSRESESMRAFAEGYSLTRAGMAWFADHYLPRREDRHDPRASPLLLADLRGMPPALILTAEFDPLRDEGEAYGARLEEAGVPVQLTQYDGMIHGFVGLAPYLDRGWEAIDEVAAYLRSG